MLSILIFILFSKIFGSYQNVLIWQITFLLVFILVDGNQRYLFLFLLCSVKYHRTKVANVTHDIVFALINQLTGNADKEQTL